MVQNDTTSTKSRLAVDIGGTFTDIVLASPQGTFSGKILTDYDAPERAVMTGAARILEEARIGFADLDIVIHGTTLATNALIERKGAKTALVTTRGFRDSLEMAFEHRFEQYDLNMERPEPLIPRPLRFEITERVAADGSVLTPLAEDEAIALRDRLVAEGVEAVAICFLHSYVNGAHERRVRDIFAEAFREEAIAISSEVAPEIREYERASTTVANAYVLPLMESYLGRLERALRDEGSSAPLLLIMSSGGVTTIDTARRLPIRLVESGPAGGAILARSVAARNDVREALAFDMGGTTAKVTLIDDFEPNKSRTFEVARAARFVKGSGIPIRIPVIDMVEIGAGGGSVARVDQLGRITVGPDSVGSTPGPACYGRGGTFAAVTDADLVLGWLDPHNFAGGKIMLDADKSEGAIRGAVADRLDMPSVEAAYGVTEIVTETMASAARVHAVESGRDVAARTMIAFGGAAPLHAARLAQKLDVRRVIIPVGAGVGSAHGFLGAPISFEVVRTKLVLLADYDAAATGALVAEMRAEAEAVVRLATDNADLVEECVAYMRYRGQGHEIPVKLPETVGKGDVPADVLRTAFVDAYRANYGRVIEGLEVEVVSWSLSLSERPILPDVEADPETSDVADAAITRTIVDPTTGTCLEASIHARSDLAVGALVKGPAIIVEEETSILVPSGFTCFCNGAGDIVLDQVGVETAVAEADGSRAIGEVDIQVMWNRLLAVVEEQAQTLVRTAFSSAAREAGDISAGIFTPDGKMLAQAVTGTPGHVNTMALAVGHFLDRFPPETLEEGDVLVTNDPWKGTGHLFDITVVTPTFREGKLVALFASTTHVVDIGGIGASVEGKQIYHEGLFLPLMKIARRGVMSEDLLDIVRANVREPVQLVGDLHALTACNAIGAKALLAMMASSGLETLDVLAEEILRRTHSAMRAAINVIPDGSWKSAMTIDGFGAPIEIVGTLTKTDGLITVDFTGSGLQTNNAINCPMCYTEAYTAFAVKAALAPFIPNNDASLQAVVAVAPEGSILNAQYPAAVYARAIIGHMIPDVVYGCLHQVAPHLVPAEGTSNLWNLNLMAGHGLTEGDGKPFTVTMFHSGGTGARPTRDGLAATPFPSGVRNVAVEITESITPLVIWRKEFRADSGGAGRQRGGLGQIIEVGCREDRAFGISARFDRVRFAPRGRDGGLSGAGGRLELTNGLALLPKGFQIIPAGDVLRVEMPGGGGMGHPFDRDPEAVARDVHYGLCSIEKARLDYGVAVDAHGVIDADATARLRRVSPQQASA